MPCEIAYENNASGALIACTGEVTCSDVKAVKGALYTPDLLQRLRYQIWDFTSATKLNLTPEDLQECAVMDGEAFKANPLQIRALVGSEALFRGLDRLFVIYTEVWSTSRIRTFATLDEARTWVAGAAV